MRPPPSTTAANPKLSDLAATVEFPVTICVLCYGANVTLARRFLVSLYKHTHPSLFHLRAGLNEAEPATRRLFQDYTKDHGNIEIFEEPRNVFKNPMMRRLFHEKPLTSRWTLWCDDDTYFVKNDWLQRLSLKIECAPQVALWGQIFSLWNSSAQVRQWIKDASWYRGRPVQTGLDPQGNQATEFRFATGGFWAIRTQVLQDLDWPDRRLVQANEDFLLGEALRQNQYELGSFHAGIVINDAPRRNAHAPEIHQLTPNLPQQTRLTTS